jgi:hypothetical protein
MDSASTPDNVVDLAARRARRMQWEDDEAGGRLLFLELRAEARATIAALVAGGVP